jgi:NAD(P)-dependent dehydrogenase (short-subunit alcohol dehydrogenase family)
MNLRLTDKTALVSGSTKGIGFAIATGLARERVQVIVHGRSEKAVAEAKEHIDRTVIESFAGSLQSGRDRTLLEHLPRSRISGAVTTARPRSSEPEIARCGWTSVNDPVVEEVLGPV